MSERTLARLVASQAVFERTVELAALQPPDADSPYYDEMLLRFRPGVVETPAGTASSSLATYCTASEAVFDELAVPHGEATAVFDIEQMLDWLAWVGEGETVDVEFRGDPDRGVASHAVLRRDGLSARVDCYRDPALMEQVTFELPSRFTEDDRFRLEDESLAPTRVETTAETVARIAAGVDLDPYLDHYPFVVRDGELRVELRDGATTRASGPLAGRVEGPDVDNRYGEGFSRVFETLSGDVSIQTGTDEPLVVVQSYGGFTLRYVVLPVVW